MEIKYFNINMIQIMKKNILPLLMAVVALCSCSDENLGGFSGIKTGEVIDFGVSAVKTRANYKDEIDSKQVQWEKGDVVRIYYVYTNTNGTVKTHADYKVIPVDGEGEIVEYNKIGSLEAENPDKVLKWGDGTNHRFYAVYPAPADDEITIDENGVATFPINRDQKCTIRTPNEKEVKNNYTYVAEPDDRNIYMVASATARPQSGSVWLDFKPIMTTINVVVKGPLNTTENQKTPNVVVTGVSLISTITTNTNASKSEFKYDITNGTITGSGSASGTGTATKQTETTFISVVNPKDGVNAIEMEKGQTLVLTGFLPPMATETAQDLERTVQIRVHTTGGNKTMTLENATALLPSAKGAIKLPSLYTPITGSNWITPLDDDIYVSQLSIPGTHDAATVHCTDAILGLSESGQCQQYTIKQQLEMGIRVFDIRPSGSDLAIYHGMYACYNGENSSTPYKLSDIYGFFNDFLKDNSGEFIIVILRWEEERVILSLNKEKQFNGAMSEFVDSDVYNKYALPRATLDKELQNLTVGDMRGHILSIMRPNQGTDPDGYFQEEAPAGMMFISGFPGSHPEGSQQAYLKNQYVDYGTDQWGKKTEWIVYCQNYYEVSQIKEGGILGIGGTVIKTEEQAVADKLESVKTYIEHATTQANGSDNIWVINHCSGYKGSNAIFSAYAQLAQDLNKPVYEYINDRTTPGSLGMILLDFVGTRTWNGYQVYGDLLPQAIIDNNYKYRMKRKGEENNSK